MQKTQNEKWMDLNLMDQEDPEATKEKSLRLCRILNANYKNPDLEQEVNKLTHLTKFQRVILLSRLKLYEDLFNGNLGDWTGPLVDTPPKDDSKT